MNDALVGRTPLLGYGVWRVRQALLMKRGPRAELPWCQIRLASSFFQMTWASSRGLLASLFSLSG